jgi:Icc-related predicted phosphoesterase
MHVHIFSDLHLEFAPCEFSQRVRSGILAELVLLAGDIHVNRRGPAWAAATFSQPVAMIGGNHEAYGDSLYASIAANRKYAITCSQDRRNPIRFLERETWEVTALDGTPVRVIATTLWTDFEVFGESRRPEAMALAARDMNDFHRIRILDTVQQEPRRFDPNDAVRLHQESRLFLGDELEKRFDGITIVMTHHAPSSKSIPTRSANDPLTAAYVSDLDDLIQKTQPHLWVHGHLHTSSDYMIGATRIVCNPRGYHPFELNPDFDPELVIEIDR